jgi:lactoylglutathione lyase
MKEEVYPQRDVRCEPTDGSICEPSLGSIAIDPRKAWKTGPKALFGRLSRKSDSIIKLQEVPMSLLTGVRLSRRSTRQVGVWAAILSAGVMLSSQWGAVAQPQPADSPFASTTIDLGTVVSDLDRSTEWYVNVIGFEELDPFDVPGEFGKKTGLSNNLPFHVHVLSLGRSESATKLKLMQFKTSPGARVDQTFVHSTYGFRYLTIFVADLAAAVARAEKAGAKPIADGVVAIPESLAQGTGLAVFRDPDGNFVELVGPWKP